MRLDVIAKEINFIKKMRKSSRIQPYRHLGDDNVQAGWRSPEVLQSMGSKRIRHDLAARQ